MVKGFVAGASLLGLVSGAVMVPSPAKAWWVRERYVAPLVVAPPVVVVRPVRVWVRPHYTRFGYFVPGHWR